MLHNIEYYNSSVTISELPVSILDVNGLEDRKNASNCLQLKLSEPSPSVLIMLEVFSVYELLSVSSLNEAEGLKISPMGERPLCSRLSLTQSKV